MAWARKKLLDGIAMWRYNHSTVRRPSVFDESNVGMSERRDNSV
jgi:hypothetical protein